ncbi:MAG: hypothetical protein WC563_15390 [Brevundimonas sp.]
MAANTRTFSPPASLNQIATATHFNKLDTNGAESVNRNSTVSGWKHLPLIPAHTNNVAAVVLVGTGGVTTIANVAFNQTFSLVGLLHGMQFTGCRINIIPDVAHGAGAPIVLPVWTVYRVSLLGAATSLGTATYVWGVGDPAAYDAGYSLSIPAFAHTIDLANYRYVAELTPESGLNSQLSTLQSIQANSTIDHAAGGTDLSLWI